VKNVLSAAPRRIFSRFSGVPLFRRREDRRAGKTDASSGRARVGHRESGLRASVRRTKILRTRIEAVEALSLHPYLQAMVAFSLAAAEDALGAFRDEVAGSWEEAEAPLREFVREMDGSRQYERALSALGWAYATRAVEVSWPEPRGEVLRTLTDAVPVIPSAERIVAYGAVGDNADRQSAFQWTVFRSIYEAVTRRDPSEELVLGCASKWFFAWTEGWAAFGRLLGEYERAPRPKTAEVTSRYEPRRRGSDPRT
jgi:hypothetical protein